MSLIFWDYETAGLERHHPNIQLAAVVVDDGFTEELESYEAKIQFDPATAEPKALEVNRYTPEAWLDAKPERQVMREFLAVIERHRTEPRVSAKGKPYKVARLAGHNVVAFDKPRLEDMWQRHFPGQFFPADHRCLDTLQRIMWWAFERHQIVRSFTLGASLELLGIKAEGPLHDALWDCRASIAIAKFMADEARRKVASA